MSLQPNLRILIVDDNQEIHKDFIKILTRKPVGKIKLAELENEIFEETGAKGLAKVELPIFEIKTASQGQEGVDLISQALEEGKPYALAFVDIRMPPGLDGVETIKKIWAIDPDVQMVICTAYSDYSWEATIEQLGQTENLLILKKPFDNIAVRQLSAALTKKWLLLKETRGYTDLLEKRVQERTTSLQSSLSITRGTLESSVDGILVLDKDNNIIDYNTKLIGMWGVPESILESRLGSSLINFIADAVEEPDRVLHLGNMSAMQSDSIKTEKLKCKSGRRVELDLQPYFLEEKLAGRIWNFRDISKRVLLEEQIQFQATHDVLTGLPNRALLMERIQNEILSSQKTGQCFGLFFIDLDRFKLVNDSFSHSTGDQLLKDIASRIQAVMRDQDLFARIGGDEFVGIITSTQDQSTIHEIILNILSTFKNPFIIHNHSLYISPSIGVGVYPQDGNTVDELMRRADLAMYRAKGLGGNQFSFYEPELERKSIERLQSEEDLHRAITCKEFFLCYQPQYNLTNKKFTSVEALIRWQHPAKGLILPINFIPLTEDTGLIIPIGEWVLRTACCQNKLWQVQGFDPIRVAVNISTKQFMQTDFVALIKDVLKEADLKPEYLELELTENIVVENILVAAGKIAELREFGVQISLDDFGTGYSSLNHLRNMQLDRLKIDRSFIQNIDINRDDEVIIQAIITMVKNLNLQVLAEGVETQEQLDYLRSKKCGEIQGFYFSKPLTAEELENLFRNPVDIDAELA